jgi:hypothetical protein
MQHTHHLGRCAEISSGGWQIRSTLWPAPKLISTLMCENPLGVQASRRVNELRYRSVRRSNSTEDRIGGFVVVLIPPAVAVPLPKGDYQNLLFNCASLLTANSSVRFNGLELLALGLNPRWTCNAAGHWDRVDGLITCCLAHHLLLGSSLTVEDLAPLLGPNGGKGFYQTRSR